MNFDTLQPDPNIPKCILFKVTGNTISVRLVHPSNTPHEYVPLSHLSSWISPKFDTDVIPVHP
jgi:hypothetical protein